MRAEVYKSLRFNMLVNLLDGSFFGLAAGLSSVVTVLPLFVSTMTSSPVLIGLIPAVHNIGWQLPQLFIARWIGKQKRVKPLVLGLSTLERLPYLGLAALAFLNDRSNNQLLLTITFSLLIIQGFGAGLTANPWQVMVGKIMPAERRGTFFGLQSGLSNFLGGFGAVIAGLLLGRIPGPKGFGWCFLITAGLMVVSWTFLRMTREPEYVLPAEETPASINFSSSLLKILRTDASFRWFLAAKIVSQLSIMGYAYYSIYAVNVYGVSKFQIGIMTGALMGANFLANVLMGWYGDRSGHRRMMITGMLSMALSALVAWQAPTPDWFFLVFILAAVGNVAIWTVSLSMILEYGREEERPVYIGLSNTLVAPVNLLVPFLGGWLVARFGYPAVFAASAFGGLAAALILALKVQDHPEAAAAFSPEQA